MTLFFIADEGVDRSIVVALREEGHEVISVAELSPGIPDEDVLELANRRNALLITSDKDFGELVYRKELLASGVILVRLSGMSSREKARILSTVIRERHNELMHCFTVIRPGQVRIRQRL